MAGQMSLLVFGDQTLASHSFLKEILLRAKSNVLCTSFLAKANAALRAEVAQLPREMRETIPSFSTIRELSDRYNHSRIAHTGIDSALLCITQLAHYISANDSDDLSTSDTSSTLLTGLCTGSLAAAAVASAPSGSALVPIAVEVVRVAFRTGVHVESTARRIYQPKADPESWAYLVPELSADEARVVLDDFHREAGINATNRAYLSAVDANLVTISGPPPTLQELFSSARGLAKAKRISLPIYGPYHAPHLHNTDTVDQILSGIEEIDDLEPKRSVLSASTGNPVQAKSTRELLKAALSDILIETLCFNRLVLGCSASFKDAQAAEVLVSAIGPINTVKTIMSKLKQDLQVPVRAGHHALWFSEKQAGEASGSRQPKDDRLAIVGMAGRFPSSGDHDKFWQLLMDGVDAHREVPSDRFDAKTYYDPTSKIRNTSHTPYGCFINDPGMFDPRFFNMSPREAAQTDPMQRLALVTAYEALEMAGYVPNRTPATQLERIGTYYGQTSDDWREINAAQDVDTYFITGGVRAFGPGRINYTFKFSGPSFSVDTACSSSMAAIQIACTALRAGECDTAVAGGVSVMTNPDIFSGLSRGQFLSKTGNCQTWDNDADGYCRADGVGTVVLKRLSDAEADNDNILAVILGSATNHSAEAISITHPHAETQEFLYQKILDEAGVDALDVDFVEMHGTGTQAGDGTEMRSVTNVFAPSHRRRRPDQKLYLGAVKSNVGHGEAASGITALVKCLMMLKRNTIPPHVGVKKQLNVGFPKDLEARNVHIAFGGSRPFKPRTDRRRLVFVNNFSAAGGNTGLLLQEAPEQTPKAQDPRSTHVVAVTAKAKSSLKKNIENLIAYIDENPTTRLQDLAYTTTARRIQHNYRVVVPVSSMAQVRSELASALEAQISGITSTKPQVGFVFTGQGSHYAALGRDLFEHETQFEANLRAYDGIAMSFGFPSFLPLIDGSVTDVATLSATLVQVGLACIQMALARLWQAWGVTPDFVMGHSLGEYAALNVSGVLSVSDTIFLVGTRARLLEQHCTVNTHAMLAVKSSQSCLDGLPRDLHAKLQLSCVNGPQDTVLGGEAEDIAAATEYFATQGTKCTKLNVPFAFHTSQVDPILDLYEEIASSIQFSEPKIAMISTLLGGQISGAITSSYLSRHAREPVNFLGALQFGKTHGLIDESTIWVEVGPHPVCLGMVKSTFGPKTASGASLKRGEDFWKTASSTACTLHSNGVSIDWNEFHRSFKSQLQLLDLPRYSFDEKNYWIQYTGDWCLSKGAQHPLVGVAAAAVEQKSKLSTTTIHKIVEEKVEKDQITLVTESDITRPDLRAAVSGHLVNGTALCPSSIYADMAMTVCDYMAKLARPSEEPPQTNVRSMEVSKPLIAQLNSKEPHILRLTAKTTPSLRIAELKFSSTKDKVETVHAHCVVEYGDGAAWMSEWQRIAYLVQDRVKSLKAGIAEASTHRIKRGMAYKLFAAFVDYDQKYRGMEDVILDSEAMEATAHVRFQTKPSDGEFFCSPYWIDSCAHISGFIVNGTDAIDSSKQVYISHGWESMRFARPLSADKTYRSYVRMQPADKTIMAGDVYIFDEEEGTIIGMVGGLKFQCIPRAVLNTFLPPVGGAAKTKAAAPAVPVQPKIKVVHVEERAAVAVAVVPQTPTRDSKAAPSGSVIAKTLDIIAEEMGISVDELEDPIDFADMGCDSLMSLSISGRMREEMDINISSHAFVDYPTVGKLKGFLMQFETAGSQESHMQSSPFMVSDSSSVSSDSPDQYDGKFPATPASSHGSDIHVDLTKRLDELSKKSAVLRVPSSPRPARSATSVLLQGSPRRASKTLWMLPDGGGSATSYVSIPDLDDSIAVYGLNSPYMRTPEEYDQGLVEITTKFIVEMRRKQPVGPYTLAGWSAGGVVAFEACRQLVEMGESVEKLLLIDSPCPLIIEPLPASLHQFFNEIGLLGDGLRESSKVPSWLLPHFAASVTALSNYDASELPVGKRPKTLAIWCTDGVCKEEGDRRPDPYPYGHAQWLLENRTDFGPNLWDRFLGEESMVMKSMPGNHFTMMRSPNVEVLGKHMRDFMMS